MAIVFLSEADAEKKFESTLVDWHLAHNYKGCYSPAETLKYVMSFFTLKGRQSATARQIYEYVSLSPKKVYVVGMRGGFQCFNSTEGENKDMPVIFLDVDGKLEIFVRAPHGVSLGTTYKQGAIRAKPWFHSSATGPKKQEFEAAQRGYARANALMMTEPEKLLAESKLIAAEVAEGKRAQYAYDMGNRISLDNRIAALHEFGHAKQWLERPMFFDQQKLAARTESKESRERRLRTDVKPERRAAVDEETRRRALGLGGTQKDVRLADQRKGFAKELQEKAEKRWASAKPIGEYVAGAIRVLPEPKSEELAEFNKGMLRGGLFRTKDELADFEKALESAPVWGRAIEMDNMERHEWPICRELGLPIRANYRDLDATTTAQASATTQILRLAETKRAELAKLEEKRKRDEAEAAAIAARSKQGTVCPICKASFKIAAQLRPHMSSSHDA